MIDPVLDGGLLASRVAPALAAAIAMIHELPASPHARELRAQARTYERLVAKWEARGATPPNESQLEALFDLVVELQGKAAAAAHSARSAARTIR